MGLLSEGTPLDWPDTKQNAHFIRQHGIEQFLFIYNKFKDLKNFSFKWGDEVEFSLVKFDHENKKCYLLLNAERVLKSLNSKTNATTNQINNKYGATFHPEYASYMVEATPHLPFDHTLNCFKYLEENMSLRRKMIQNELDKDEYCISLTNFPLLGGVNFTWPNHPTRPRDGISRSLFFPDEAIFCGHPRFRTLSKNVRLRRNCKPAIYVPIYVDKETKQPFKEDLTKYDKLAANSKAEDDEFNKVNGDGKSLRDNFIYMDAAGFGMGCCCLQMTFQSDSISEARYLYDQLAPITPIMLALSAASPIWRGYLSDVDCRWNVISGSVDDRTREELGFEPLRNDRFKINKSRYDSIDSYLSEHGAKYNDLDLVKDNAIYEQLISRGVDHLLAQHVAHLFIRDPLVVFKEKLVDADQIIDLDHFENIQSTNWQTMRFKPPPIPSSSSSSSPSPSSASNSSSGSFTEISDKTIGWRVEFRPTELQITDFENSAFCSFIILLTRAIQTFNVNFLMPISKVDINMQRAQQRNSCLNEKFYFRQNIESSLDDECILVEMTIDEIINGSDKHNFKGLLKLIKDYIKLFDEIDSFAQCKLSQYLLLIESRANGNLMTLASWIRKFVQQHPTYKHDSIINEQINYDLIWTLNQIANGQLECPDLILKSFKTSC